MAYPHCVGSLRYAQIRNLARLLTRRFFRRIEVTGLEHVPPDGGGVLVSWHPNGVIDPVLIMSVFPRSLSIGARHTLFDIPLFGWLMKGAGAVPIQRPQEGGDPEARKSANQAALGALAERVAEGHFTCLFPEGTSHDGSDLLEFKTGAARFFYQARAMQPAGAPMPLIVPVGLHYNAKSAFRSSALVSFHPPLYLPPHLDVVPPGDEPDEVARARAQELTDLVERALREVVHATETWEMHHLMHRVRKLVRAERAKRAGAELEPPDMRERTLGFARVWAGYYANLETHPAVVESLRARVREYDADLRALDLEDHELDRAPDLLHPGLVVVLAVQTAVVFLVLPPVIVWGLVANAPTALLLEAITHLARRHEKDEASIRLFAGSLLFPLAWTLFGIACGLTASELEASYPALPHNPIAVGVVSGIVAAMGGALAVHYLRMYRETWRSLRIRLTRARRRIALARLRVERGEIFDAVQKLMEDVELPGEVNPQGRIVWKD